MMQPIPLVSLLFYIYLKTVGVNFYKNVLFFKFKKLK